MGKKKGILSALLGAGNGKKKSSSTRASKSQSKPSSSKRKSAASKSKSITKTAPKSSKPKGKSFAPKAKEKKKTAPKSSKVKAKNVAPKAKEKKKTAPKRSKVKAKNVAPEVKEKKKTASKDSKPKVKNVAPEVEGHVEESIEGTKKGANVSKRYPNGRTLKTKDEYLPIEKGNSSNNPKDERWLAVIDSNRKDELAVVRLTTQRQPNTTELSTYKKGNKKRSFFKHFVEIEDNEGNPIKVDGKKFKENNPQYDLSSTETTKIRDKCLDHVKQSTENKKKIADLKKNGDV